MGYCLLTVEGLADFYMLWEEPWSNRIDGFSCNSVIEWLKEDFG